MIYQETKTRTQDINPGHRRYSRRPNYAARRAGAVLLTGMVLFPVAKVLAERVSNIVGEPVPTLQSGDPNNETVTVQPADTAWNIARTRTTGDIRPLVSAIMDQPDAQNGLQPGDKLVVPTTVQPNEPRNG